VTGRTRAQRDHVVIDLADRAPVRRVAVPSFLGTFGTLHPVSLDSSGRRIAMVPGNRIPHVVHAGPAGDLQEVPRTKGTFGVVDWADDGTIVALRRSSGSVRGGSALYRVSLPTGESRKLVSFPANSYGGSWQFATDLLTAPVADAVGPPAPLDPRKVTGLLGGTALAGIGGIMLWRRRVRP
jgi:hypothetical protein